MGSSQGIIQNKHKSPMRPKISPVELFSCTEFQCGYITDCLLTLLSHGDQSWIYASLGCHFQGSKQQLLQANCISCHLFCCVSTGVWWSGQSYSCWSVTYQTSYSELLRIKEINVCQDPGVSVHFPSCSGLFLYNVSASPCSLQQDVVQCFQDLRLNICFSQLVSSVGPFLFL